MAEQAAIPALIARQDGRAAAIDPAAFD